MTTQHTPGRLRYDYEAGYCGEFIASNGTTVGTFNSEPSEADARRLVACWNACEGLTTKNLENLDMMGETLAERFAAFRANECELLGTRDELLAALKAIIAGGLHCDVPHLHEKAIAAIAKAERKE